MTSALDAFQEALVAGADDDALDVAAADVRRDSGPAALVEAIKMRIAHDRGQGKTELDLTALRFRLAAALEETARTAAAKEGAFAALEAAELYRDVLNDGEATTRTLVIALRLAANDDAALKRAVEQAGGREPSETMLEKALKKPEVKGDAALTAQVRRALSRLAEQAGDKERAFFEGLKAARKQPSDGMYVDEVFRLALETLKFTEASAFFAGLADDGGLPARNRATLYNKLGQTLEKQGEKAKALEAFTKSLAQHETKAAKRAVERLAEELGVEPGGTAGTPLIAPNEPVDVTPPFDRRGSAASTQQERPAEPSSSVANPFARPALTPEEPAPPSQEGSPFHDSTEAPLVAPPEDNPFAAPPSDPGEPKQPAHPVTAPIPRPISVPPAPPSDDDDDGDAAAQAAAAVAAAVVDAAAAGAEVDGAAGEPSLSNLPSFDDGPAFTPSNTEPPPRSSPARVEAPSLGNDASPFASPLAPPRTAVEEALARLPDRSEVPEEPTTRADPGAGLTAQNTAENTAERPRAKKKDKKKKEKTQKRKKPVAPSEARVLVDNQGDLGVRPAMTPAWRRPGVGGAAADLAAREEAPTPAQPFLASPPRTPPPPLQTMSGEAHIPSDVDASGVIFRPEQAGRADERARALDELADLEMSASVARPRVSDTLLDGVAEEGNKSADASGMMPRPGASLEDGAVLEHALAPPGGGLEHAGGPEDHARIHDHGDDDVDHTPPLPKPHTLSPPPGESTDHGRSAPSEKASPTVEAMPPLVVPPLTMPSMEASGALADALAALDSDDADVCTRAARKLAEENPHDPRVLRLAARAMSLSAPSGQMPADAVDLFVAHAPQHGERAAQMAVEVQKKLPPAVLLAYTHVWLAGAKAAGLDVARVMDLLRVVAVDDAPGGPAFEHAERIFIEVNDGDGRDALYQSAYKALDSRKIAPSDAAAARVVLTQRRLELKESQSKHVEALALHASLAVDLASADVAVRAAARRAFAQHGSPDERARFLSRLARKLPGEEGVDVVQELLDVRLSVDDRIGAEAAAKDLLARRPGDGRATRVLADLLEQEPRRVDELVDVLRVGAQQALSWFGKTGEARTFLERLAEVQARAGRAEEAADAWVQVARLVPDDKNLDRALDALDAVKRHKEAVALLEETAGTVADAAFRCRAWLRAGEIARSKLQKRGKARELVEKALDQMPRDRGALRVYADLLVEIGDAAAAVSALERVAAEESSAKDKAALQMRIGRLVEEHLLKPDDALKRYRAAAEMDPANKDAWDAIRAIARQRGDREMLIEALRGLAGAESDPKEKVAHWRNIAKVERDERSDVVAAERAFGEALAIDPGDVESLLSLAALLAARLQPDMDLDTALAQPNEALLEALRAPVLKAPAPSSLPLSLRRMSAMALSRNGDRQAASARFDEILQETPEDLPTLMALARHLASAPRMETGADARRLRCLETILLHHAYSLKPPVQVDVWGDVTALRAATGDGAGARKAAKKVMALASTDELRACLSDRAARAVALALDDARDAERDPKAIIAALKLDAERSVVESERSRILERCAQIAMDELKDRVFARALLEDAVRANPQSQSARESLLDLDVASGDVAGALKQVRDLLSKESDPKRKASLHLRLFRMRKKLGLDMEGAAAELKSAVELDSASQEVLDAAEQFFTERNDADGLDKLWSAQLKNVDRADVRSRLKLLERLAQLRRYERRDLAGAVEALEAMTALDPEAQKPREDAARLYTELGLVKEAVNAWRSVLDRDPLAVEAWRGIFSRFVYTRQGDEAFAVASTMVALELADDDMIRAVRTIRPPFPRWPIPPKDTQLFRRKVAHPLERAPIRAALDVVAPRLLPLYARRLKDFGFHKRDALPDKMVPTSVLLAVRTLSQLFGFKEPPPIFQAELGSTEGQSPPFAVMPSTEPGVIVTGEVIKGGMTPERAFALGRAFAWLQPHAVMAAAVDAATLRSILEALVSAFLGPKNLERPDLDAEKLGKELAHSVLSGLSQADEAIVKGELLPALRDYVHARSQVQVADWRAGVGYSGDRLGFLLSTDLNAAFRLIKTTSGAGQSIGARLAIKELVLFSVSAAYLGLRKDLGLALPEMAASPLLDLA